MHKLDSLFKPKSIAIIGASRDKSKLGRLVLDNLIQDGYKGKILPINPKAKKIKGYDCFPSVAKVPGNIDLAVIAIPAKFVLQVFKECCDKKVNSVVIITAGYSEIGQEGLEEEFKLREIARSCDINLLGPNCLGVIATTSSLNATFAKNQVRKGNIAFMSQSGALGTAALDWAWESGVGFSHFISIGNKANLSENSFLEYLEEDPDVKAIFMYLEDFANGKEFIKIASALRKPVVVLKPGKSEAAQTALGSHTGSLAEDDFVVSQALKQSRVLRVDEIEEMFNLMKLFSSKKNLKDKRIAIVTNAGGPGVITTDVLELTDLKLADLANKTKQYLAMNLPAAANFKNPIDILGDALSDRYEIALKAAEKDKGVDAVIAILTPQVMTEVDKTAQIIMKIAKKSKKFILPVFIGGDEVKSGMKIFECTPISYFTFPEDAVKALSQLNRSREVKSERIRGIETPVKVNKNRVRKLFEGKKGSLDTQTAERMLKAYRIPVLDSYFPQDIAACRKFAKKLSYPIVMKLVHPKLLHKTDVKAVMLDISDEEELTSSFTELDKLGKKLKLEGYKIQMQRFIKGALELILGAKFNANQYVELKGKQVFRKGGFGHSIVFGMGGIYTEVYKDVSLKIAPLSRKNAINLIDETKVGEIIRGLRGQKYNHKKIVDIILKLSQLVVDFPQIVELDINPLFAKGKGVWVIDVKMILGG